MTRTGCPKLRKRCAAAAILAAAGLALPLLYLLAAATAALLPANAGWKPASAGIPIYVRTNGVHTEIVVPYTTADVDWHLLVRPNDMSQSALAGDHLAFGWGDRNFYLATPTWKDLAVGTALHAIFRKQDSLLHVYHRRRPASDPDQRRLILRRDEYLRLSRYIRASFRLTRDGASVPLPGYEAADVFYEAQGDWSVLRTSNEWTGAGLRQAGVRIGWWTPFAGSVMLWIP